MTAKDVLSLDALIRTGSMSPWRLRDDYKVDLINEEGKAVSLF